MNIEGESQRTEIHRKGVFLLFHGIHYFSLKPRIDREITINKSRGLEVKRKTMIQLSEAVFGTVT